LRTIPEVLLIINRFHPSQRSRKRHSLLKALVASDLVMAGGLSLLVALMSPLSDHWTISTVWLLASVSAWMLTRDVRHALALDPYSRALSTPLLTVLLVLCAATVLELKLSPMPLVLIPLLWGIGMAIARLMLRRLAPPVLIGVPNSVVLPRHVRVQYVHLDTPRTTLLSAVDALLLDPSAPPAPEWLELILHAQAAGMPVWTPSTLNEELHGRVNLEHLHTARLDSADFDDAYAPIKRALDVLAVLIAFPVLLPVMLMAALLVMLDTGRPILFWQWRIGKQGVPFRIAKFRTMKRDSEQFGAAFAESGDMRVTRLGRWMRKFRLDELPQFWNVLRGDMSIIGPRPEQQVFVEQFRHELHLYDVRHWVKPGITGWAQVMHGYAAGADETLEKLRYDMYYVKNFSFWLDARIVAKTLWTIGTGFGAR
jgi:lipopolysaccharide/colanic/teichoic acid biosynthesis glycosyltransferase